MITLFTVRDRAVKRVFLTRFRYQRGVVFTSSHSHLVVSLIDIHPLVSELHACEDVFGVSALQVADADTGVDGVRLARGLGYLRQAAAEDVGEFFDAVVIGMV